MKFSIYNLLTLLSVGSAISSNLEDTLLPKNVINLISNELITDRHLFARDDQVVDTVTQLQCNASLNNSNCVYQTSDPSNTNFDEYCKPLKDEKCIAFYNKGVGELDGCKSFPKDIIELTNKQLKLQYSIMKAICEPDEEGKECPLASAIKLLVKDEKKAEEVFGGPGTEKKVIKDICRSQRCTDNSIDFFSESYDFEIEIEKKAGIKIDKTIEEKNEILGKLQSKECVEARVLKSDASSTVKKLGSTMLISISLLLYLL